MPPSCPLPTTPQLSDVAGVVRYLDGSIVVRAKVWTDSGVSFSDARVRYSIEVSADADSITLFARDGYDGRAYAVNHSGTIRLCVEPRGDRGDIVLDHAEIF